MNIITDPRPETRCKRLRRIADDKTITQYWATPSGQILKTIHKLTAKNGKPCAPFVDTMEIVDRVPH